MLMMVKIIMVTPLIMTTVIMVMMTMATFQADSGDGTGGGLRTDSAGQVRLPATEGSLHGSR